MVQLNIDCFSSRFSPRYFEDMTECLRRAHADALAGSGDIRIASVGISGSTFFQPINANDKKLYQASKAFTEEFDALIGDVAAINRAGARLSLRLIWAYPFSDYGVHLKAAEKIAQRFPRQRPENSRRGRAISPPRSPDRDQKELLDEYQNKSLVDYYAIIEYLKHSGVNLSFNQLELRFTAVPLNFRGIFINSRAYYDIYSYSRSGVDIEDVASHLPVIPVDDRGEQAPTGDGHKKYFQTLMGEFEYTWNHDATLLLEDAVQNREILPPESVTHAHKFASIDARETTVEDKIREKLLCKHHFKNSVRISEGTALREQIFIGCSWELNKRGRRRPNEIGTDVSLFISYVFTRLSQEKRLFAMYADEPIVKATLVLGLEGDNLTDEIYNALNEASHGIIILTKDNLLLCGPDENGQLRPLDDVHFSRPNVVHELGYLNHRIRRLSKGDLLTLVEKGAYYPTNENAFPSRAFERADMIGVYDEVMRWMAKHLCAYDQAAYDRSRAFLDSKGLLAKAQPGRFPDSLQDYLDDD